MELNHVWLGEVGFTHLQRLNGLRVLIVRDVEVSDAALAKAAAIKGLERLHLDVICGPGSVTDAGLVHLSALSARKSLSLSLTLHGERITDATLVRLQALPGLYQLTLMNTRVTPEGLTRLKQALPGLTVSGP